MNYFEKFLFENRQELKGAKVVYLPSKTDVGTICKIEEITNECLKIAFKNRTITVKLDGRLSRSKFTLLDKTNLLMKYEEKRQVKKTNMEDFERVIDRETNEIESEEIKKFLESRGIEYLVHFTDLENIESIKENGILSKLELRDRKIKYKSNDSYRHDKMLGHISLSITNINEEVLQSFINKGSIEHPVAIYLDATLLYKEFETGRYYCDRNAATKSCEKGMGMDSLKNMFKPSISYYIITTDGSKHRYYNRNKHGRKNCETTDPQAEILFHKRIDPKYIVDIKEL